MFASDASLMIYLALVNAFPIWVCTLLPARVKLPATVKFCVILAVGMVAVPVKVGDAKFAFKSSAAC